MKIKIFMSSAASYYETDILRNFAEGVQKWINNTTDDSWQTQDISRIGRWENFEHQPRHTVEFDYGDQYNECDLAVIFGSWKPREKHSHVVRNSVVKNSENFIVLETPLLHRVTDKENTYWRIGINGFLNRDADWPFLEQEDRELRLANFDIKWNGWNNKESGHVLLALQLPGDASLRGIDINSWACRTIKQIRKRTNKKIVIRSHPLISDKGITEHYDLMAWIATSGIKNIEFVDGASRSWSNDLKNAYCTVTYTSGLAIDSILDGVPTIACDEGNFAWNISTRSPTEIEDLYLAGKNEIKDWLLSLVRCQWSVEEMKNGDAWQALLPIVEKTPRSNEEK